MGDHMKSRSRDKKIIATNRKARFNYELLETLEAGIVLDGGEVKSARSGGVNLNDGYVGLEKNEIFLYNVNISPYKFTSGGLELKYNPQRPRKLLLHKKEIIKLQNKVNEKGFAIVPTEVYFKNGLVKVEIAVAKGKKLWDKREAIKKREVEREIRKIY
ncbi:MAG TPA: SsrA-binding protein [Elusimicrobia bacterium]|nr:SsrA-binding protein [Elusimicrobiota bacterium]